MMTSSMEHMNTIKVTCGKKDGEVLTYPNQQLMNSKENSSEQLQMSTFWKELVSLIARDENQHLVITQQILNKWRDGDDPDMKKIYKEEEPWFYKTFENAVNQEKLWSEYLFKNGSMIGLNEKLLQQYVEWIANKRMKAVGLKPVYDIAMRANPLPWTQHWISSKGLQVAPQETEVESYVVGGIKQDVKKDTFSGFKL